MKQKMSSQDNFIYLLIALIFLLFSTALVDQVLAGEGHHLILAIIVVALMLGVWSIKSDQQWFNSGLLLIAAVILVSVLSWLLDYSELNIAHHLLLLSFFVLSAKQAASQVLFSGRVDGNKVVGSICIFLLIGLIWAMLYLIATELIPSAFNGLSAATWSDLIYYSFVTLTTLGYGEITPIAPLTRFMAYIEAVIGLFYMAIVVASLVGARMAQVIEGK